MPRQVVVAAARADQAPGRIGGYPAVVLPMVPLAVLRPEDPLPSLHVLDGKGTNGLAEGGSVDAATLAGGDELEVAQLGDGEGFDCHAALG
jgi:hypothetical protein